MAQYYPAKLNNIYNIIYLVLLSCRVLDFIKMVVRHCNSNLQGLNLTGLLFEVCWV